MLKTNSIFLFFTAFIWGVSFVSQYIVNDYLEVYTYNTIRLSLGFFSLLPLVFIFKSKIARSKFKKTLIAGIICGTCLAIACNLQQYGIKYSTVGKAGFITALYIVIVPILGFCFGKKISINIIFAVIISTIGFYFISIPKNSDFSLQLGDIFLLTCAIAYATHVVATDYFCRLCDSFQLACLQFFFAAIISSIPAFAYEVDSFKLDNVYECIYAILFSGICATGVAYTFQILGQKGNNPTISAMILSLESVFSLLSGWLYLQEKIGLRMMIGCMLIGSAIVLAQLNKNFIASLILKKDLSKK
jgi:drug/metabolite transporter (DMT)-like permease